MVAASRSGSTGALMRLSSPSASTFSSQASRSLLLTLRAGPLALASAGRWSRLAAPPVTLISMGRLPLVAYTLQDRLRLRATKSPARRPGPSWGTTQQSEGRHHAFQSKKMSERVELATLVIAEAHDQREAGGFEPLYIYLAHVDSRRAGALRRFLIFHLAQLGLNCGPITLLVRRQIEPSLDAGDLRVIEHGIRAAHGPD